MLSALIIAKDEARNITRAVEALAGLVDEVVVVDTGSTDDTRVLAKAAGARVIESPWLGYGPTKNWGATQCRRDWILSVDADEVPDGELSTFVKTLTPEPGVVYGVRRVTNYCGHWVGHGAWGTDVVWRLYDRRGVRWDERVVHENLQLGGGVAREMAPGKLLHFSYPDRASYRRKQAVYLDLSVEALVASGKRPGPVKRWLAPAWRGFRDYVIRGGWRDGRAGAEIARADMWMVREKYRRLEAVLTERDGVGQR